MYNIQSTSNKWPVCSSSTSFFLGPCQWMLCALTQSPIVPRYLALRIKKPETVLKAGAKNVEWKVIAIWNSTTKNNFNQWKKVHQFHICLNSCCRSKNFSCTAPLARWVADGHIHLCELEVLAFGIEYCKKPANTNF